MHHRSIYIGTHVTSALSPSHVPSFDPQASQLFGAGECGGNRLGAASIVVTMLSHAAVRVVSCRDISFCYSIH